MLTGPALSESERQLYIEYTGGGDQLQRTLKHMLISWQGYDMVHSV